MLVYSTQGSRITLPDPLFQYPTKRPVASWPGFPTYSASLPSKASGSHTVQTPRKRGFVSRTRRRASRASSRLGCSEAFMAASVAESARAVSMASLNSRPTLWAYPSARAWALSKASSVASWREPQDT
ncbi:MAG: hypothetical protein BWY88_01176 [Synergistetes bacterium ADurb.Bin520]|nr:MAG: hypothetical protein BWY88_01176 [Synergistetes bacterium ADurb.Bin520]